MNKSIVLITCRERFFGQTRKPWVSMDTQKIIYELQNYGWELNEYSFDDVVNKNINLENRIVFYSFSQITDYRKYIKDVIRHLSKKNTVVPGYELLVCHENKGFQKIYFNNLGISEPETKYLSSGNEIQGFNLSYPLVFKTLDGSNGKGVHLVSTENNLRKILKKYDRIGAIDKMDLLRRKYFRLKRIYKEYPEYNNKQDYELYKRYVTNNKSFILQEYISGLSFDFRVLIIYDHYFVMKRFTKGKDFKASGTKIQDYKYKPEKALLDYAEAIIKKINTPFVSLDILQKNGRYYTVEYQALHFGINVVVKTKGYYSKKHDGDWEFIPNNNVIEEEIAYGLNKYLSNNLTV
ncbi:MAG: hypothetical protein JW995_07020 [Melioribacteraceae bacterium]|nr:hypothetical protein [Melioribacteraceae bacterium]